jgi:4-diphosphocytidyl-2-C-methyl-D-erythritol kinase
LAFFFQLGNDAVIASTVETFPPAKLNLFLELLGKRADGFHELQTIMVAVSRRDRLRVTRVEMPGINLQCRWAPHPSWWQSAVWDAGPAAMQMPKPHDNLVYRALDEFTKRFSYKGGFHVELEKRIPAGAGMGGASSDAAAALQCAATLTGVCLDDSRLHALAAELGSDVPFFLGIPDQDGSNPSGSCYVLATGRGERLAAIPGPRACHFVVVYPPQPLATALVYRHCQIPKVSHDVQRTLDGLKSGRRDRLAQACFNRLAQPAASLSTWIECTLASLRRWGLSGVTMTGSGSACFGIAPSARVAKRVAAALWNQRAGVSFYATPAPLPNYIRKMT